MRFSNQQMRMIIRLKGGLFILTKPERLSTGQIRGVSQQNYTDNSLTQWPQPAVN